MVITATAGASAADEDRAHATACHLYHAGCALHVAHRTHVDAWITAVSGRLHEAVTDNLAVLADCNATYLR